MQNFRDYYQLLGVDRGATGEDIKRAYRRLARRYHPDMNPGDRVAEEKFKDISEAYQVLSDPNRRDSYDRYGEHWDQPGFRKHSPVRPSKYPGGRNGTAVADKPKVDYDDNFQDFLDKLLGRRSRPTPQTSSRRIPAYETDSFRPGVTKTTYTAQSGRRDAEASLEVPLERAYQGGRERIRLGDGRSLEVSLPPGMITGQRIRLRGQGSGGGDLYLKIDVLPHAIFRLEGFDVICVLPVTPSEAVLGGQIEAPTLDGWVKMSIPAGVRPGQRLRLAGKGYPTEEGDRGDQLVEITLTLPAELSEEEENLYRQLRQIETYNPRATLPY